MAEVVHLNATVTATTAQFQREMRQAVRSMQRTTKQAKTSGSVISKSFAGIGTAVAAGLSVAAITRFTQQSIRLAAESEKALKRVESVVKATGMSAGLSAKQLDAFANQMQRTTTFSADLINEGSAALLTFKTISGDAFTRTMRVAADLSYVLGTDLKSSVLQLGKALEDPQRGLSALRRSGVSFTSSQENLIKSLAQTNRLAEAQAMILSAVEGQVGGTAAAAVNTYAGATERMGNAWEEVRKAMVEGWTGAPNSVVFVNSLATAFDSLAGAIRRTRQSGTQEFLGADLKESLRGLQFAQRHLADLQGDPGGLFYAKRLATAEEAVKRARDRYLTAARDFAPIAARDADSLADFWFLSRQDSALIDSRAEAEATAVSNARAKAMAQLIGGMSKAAAAGGSGNVPQRNMRFDLQGLQSGAARAEEQERADSRRAEFEAQARVSQQLWQDSADEYVDLWRTAEDERAAASMRADMMIEDARAAHLERIGDLTDSMVSHFGDAMAQAIVYGDDFADSMKNAFKAVAAQVISALIRTTIMHVVQTLIRAKATAAAFVAESAQNVSRAATAAGASAAAGGPIAAFAAAAATGAAVLGAGTAAYGAAFGEFGALAGVAHGGLDRVPREGTFLLQRDEGVVNAEQNKALTAFLDRQEMGADSRPVVIEFNGRELGRALVDLTRAGRFPVQLRTA